MERVIVENVSKKFKIGFRKNQSILERIIGFFSGKEPKKTLWALKNVSFKVGEGEILGVIGKNTSGKSTLLRIIARIYSADKGKIMTNGKIVSLVDLNIGMQMRLNMKDNIYFVCSLFGLSKKTIKRRFNLIVEFSGLGDFVNTKLYQFSTGMLQRLAFSIIIYCNPEILLLDEILAVGDEEFKLKSSEKIKKIVEGGATAILVSHNLELIKKYCDRVIWIDNGEILKDGDAKKVIREYLKKVK